MSVQRRRHFPPEKPRIGCLAWCGILAVTVVATLLFLVWRDGIKTNGADYKLGHEMGFVVGKSDFHNGRQRDGEKARRLAKASAESNGAKSFRDYEFGFLSGYNDGYHAAGSVSR